MRFVVMSILSAFLIGGGIVGAFAVAPSFGVATTSSYTAMVSPPGTEAAYAVNLGTIGLFGSILLAGFAMGKITRFTSPYKVVAERY